jgi:hypothetical protein
MLRLIEAARILITRVIRPEWNTRQSKPTVSLYERRHWKMSLKGELLFSSGSGGRICASANLRACRAINAPSYAVFSEACD